MSDYKKLFILVWSACCCSFNFAWAQQTPKEYPSKTVRIIIPSAPSGGTDLIARLSAQKVSEIWHQPVIIENVSGGATRTGINAVAKSNPDGYTLLLTTVNFAFIPAIYSKLNYDPVLDFSPILMLASTNSLLAVHPSLPVRSVTQLIALAKSKPNSLHIGSGGNGTVGHLVSEMFQSQAKIKLMHIPYKGTGQNTVALISGELQTLIANLPALLPYVRSNRVRALAVTSMTRARALPKLPTMAESGLPDYEYNGWYGLWAPSKTASSITQKINEDFNKALMDQSIHEKFLALDIDVTGGTSDFFAQHITKELKKWNIVAKQAQIKIE